MGFCLRFGPQIPFSEQQVAGKFPAKAKQGINSLKQGTAIEQQGSAPDFEVADLRQPQRQQAPVCVRPPFPLCSHLSCAKQHL
jgi:hypothetical protein